MVVFLNLRMLHKVSYDDHFYVIALLFLWTTIESFDQITGPVCHVLLQLYGSMYSVSVMYSNSTMHSSTY